MNALDDLRNLLLRDVENLIRGMIADPRIAIITQVDTGEITGLLAARVQLLPEGTLTGWLPIQTPWGGNGWGMVAVPTVGTQVYVDFQENSRSCGTIVGIHYDINNPPPQGAVLGELWFVHKSGSKIKMLDNGDVTVESKNGQKITLNSDTEIDIGLLTNNLKFLATVDIKDKFNNHHHTVANVQGGNSSRTTGGPSETLDDSNFTAILKAN